eukprot:6198888-Pleurochrysis_carterae.AAC.4
MAPTERARRGALPLLSLLAAAHAALMDTLEPIGQTGFADTKNSHSSTWASARLRPNKQLPQTQYANSQNASKADVETEDPLTNQVIFKISGSSADSPEASLSRAATLAGSSGLQNARRLFRNAGKFEDRHVQFGLHLWYHGYAVSAEKADEAVEVLRGSASHIATASRRPVARRTSLIPNDASFEQQTHLKAIDMPEAWSYDAGTPEIVVAIIDSGVQEDHEDLQINKWLNAGEICGNLVVSSAMAVGAERVEMTLFHSWKSRPPASKVALDDDDNGYVDDCNGYNFAADGPKLYSGDFHGTHVAGIVSADTCVCAPPLP